LASKIKKRVHDILDLSVGDDRPSLAFDIFMIVLIVTNVIAIILESEPSLHDVYHKFFLDFEIISVAIFTVEYIMRVWCCTADIAHGYEHPFYGRIKYILSPLAIIDFLAFAPFYIGAFVVVDLRILRIFRLLRLLKLTRYSPALNIIWAVIVTQRRALTAALLIMGTTLIFSASIVYVCEHKVQPETFGSIPKAMWWSIATLTTVGYGDAIPMTPIGRVFGAITMILGIGMLALPTGVIATGFATEIKKHDFVVNWRLVSKVPLFSNLNAEQIAEIVILLKPLVLPPRHAIIRMGETADSMYFIVTGRVEIETHPVPLFLKEGDYFGEIGLLKKSARTAAVVTLTHCQLLELSADDFWHLVDKHPSLQEVIEATAVKRLVELEKSGEATKS